MRSQARRLTHAAAGAAIVAALAAGCASTGATAPQRFLVHVDTLSPDKVQQFEQARVRFVEKLRATHRTDRRGLYLKIGPNTYFSMESFVRWRDLDAIGDERAAAGKALEADAREYDRLCDEALVFPHASEIWREELALAYAPTGRRLTDAVQVVIEDVKPTANYEAAWRPIAAALAQAKYPLERRTYFSSYGSGRTLSFWMAPSPAVLKAAPTLEQVLTAVAGEARAKAMLAAWRNCVAATQTFDVEAKPEMTSY